FLAGLLALAGVLGVGEGHLLHRKALRVKSADFAKSGSLFQSFPSKLRISLTIQGDCPCSEASLNRISRLLISHPHSP
ncbi:hypothetical protein, partial [Pseudomonas aeruginosa]|uniref:hypothetical protein n=1 Tax=Pseudomonas aeruginosa TaxID=287 RepID=UPI002FE3E86F